MRWYIDKQCNDSVLVYNNSDAKGIFIQCEEEFGHSGLHEARGYTAVAGNAQIVTDTIEWTLTWEKV